MRRLGRRVLALVSLVAAAAAGTAAVLSALAAPSTNVSQAQAATQPAPRSVDYGHSRVNVHVRPGGRICFDVRRGSSTVARSCAASLAASEIRYASSRTAIGGIAGANVRAVIVRLTKKGTVWATLRRGTFYADVPKAHAVRALVKVTAGGARRTFTVTGSR